LHSVYPPASIVQTFTDAFVGLHRRFRWVEAFVGLAFVGLRTCWFLNISNDGQAIATSSPCRIKRTHVYVRVSGTLRSANLVETCGPFSESGA
jgi:hypothetical protein